MIVPVVVEGQSLRWYGRIPEIADNSIEFVQLEFRFPEDWDGMIIVAQFTQTKTYNCLLVNNMCFLPMELVAGPCEVSVFGYLNEEVTRGTTIPLKLNISRSGFVSSAETPIPPTPDLYAQLIEYFSSIAGSGGGSGTINPEDIAAAVEDYLSKNPPEVPDLSDEVTRAETAAQRAESANSEAQAALSGAAGAASDASNYAQQAQGFSDSASGRAGFADTRANEADAAATKAEEAASDAEAAAARAEEAAKVTTDLDTTLTQAGKAADAKAVGDAISKLSGGNVDQVSVEPMDGDLPKVFLTGEAFSDMTAEKNEVLMDMEYISKTDRFKGAIKIKWQGSSSVSNTNFLRKNFTVKLYVDDTYADKLKKTFKDWGVKENKWVLKSNWIDITASRNIVSARLWDQIVSTRSDYASLPEEIRTSPRNCEVDGFPVKLYANGVYEGIYTWNIPKDGFMFNMDEDNPNHAVLCAEKNNDVGTLTSDAILACEFRKAAKIDGSDWSLEFPDDLQDGIKTSFNNLINFVMTASDDDFTANLNNYLDVQSAIDYYIFAYLNCGTDSLGKNVIMMTYNGQKWYASQYDMDSTWGLHFAGSRFYEPTMKCPEEYQENNSLLWQRIVNCFAQRLQDRYFELRKTVLSETNIINEFERFVDGIPYEIREEEKNLEAYTTRPLKFNNNIQQIRSFVVSRAVYVDEQFRNIVPIMPTGITLDNSAMTVALDGTATLTATIEPEDATSKAVVWASNNKAVATVEDGVVSGISEGSAVITATTTNGLSASCAVTVKVVEIPVTGLSFSETEISVNMEETAQYQLAVAYTPANTTQKDIVWASNNPSVATVENGLVTFVAKGNATITATSVNNPSAVASCVFNVAGSQMIDYYFCGADRMSAGGNNVTTYSAYESAGFCNGIVEFPTKNSEKAIIECDVLEVVPDNQKRTAEKSIIAGFDNGTTNYLSMKFPVADVPVNSATALYTYLHNNPIHAKFKMCEGVKEYDIPLTGWTRNIQSEAGFKYYFTLNIDSTIASAIESSASKNTSIGEFLVNANSQGQTEYRHAITLSGGVLELRIPFTGAEQTVEDAMAYLSQFGTPKIYYV